MRQEPPGGERKALVGPKIFYPGWRQRPGHARAPGFDHRAGLARRILNEEFSVSSPRLWCLRASLIQYKISQKDTINQINIRVTNQDNEDISTLGDWNLTLQFERHDEDMTESILNQIKEYIKYIFIVLGEYITRR